MRILLTGVGTLCTQPLVVGAIRMAPTANRHLSGIRVGTCHPRLSGGVHMDPHICFTLRQASIKIAYWPTKRALDNLHVLPWEHLSRLIIDSWELRHTLNKCHRVRVSTTQTRQKRMLEPENTFCHRYNHFHDQLKSQSAHTIHSLLQTVFLAHCLWPLR